MMGVRPTGHVLSDAGGGASSFPRCIPSRSHHPHGSVVLSGSPVPPCERRFVGWDVPSCAKHPEHVHLHPDRSCSHSQPSDCPRCLAHVFWNPRHGHRTNPSGENPTRR